MFRLVGRIDEDDMTMKMRRRRVDRTMKYSPPLVDKSNTEVVFVDTRGIKNIKYVIFPNNKWIQVWDLWMIFAIWYFAFSTPFAIGISRGYISGKRLLQFPGRL